MYFRMENKLVLWAKHELVYSLIKIMYMISIFIKLYIINTYKKIPEEICNVIKTNVMFNTVNNSNCKI